MAVYLVAVFHRTSLGVAGLQAATRFGISPSQLSIFVLLQLGVYAVMQIPTGILVDRYGPRRLLILAALTMGLAQLLFAVAGSYPVALLAGRCSAWATRSPSSACCGSPPASSPRAGTRWWVTA